MSNAIVQQAYLVKSGATWAACKAATPSVQTGVGRIGAYKIGATFYLSRLYLALENYIDLDTPLVPGGNYVGRFDFNYTANSSGTLYISSINWGGSLNASHWDTKDYYNVSEVSTVMGSFGGSTSAGGVKTAICIYFESKINLAGITYAEVFLYRETYITPVNDTGYVAHIDDSNIGYSSYQNNPYYEDIWFIKSPLSSIGSASMGKHTASVGKNSNKYGR